MKKFFSKYSFKYPRSLTYMLQASDYRILPYLKWWWRAGDFNAVETRKHLVFTKKATLVLVFIWFINIFSYLYAFKFFLNGLYLEGLALVFLQPYLLAVGILLPLFLIEWLIQKPLEFFMIRKARQVIWKHSAIKIGIAGSFGKTTMREILKTVLGSGLKVAGPGENFNTLIGISRFAKNLKGDEQVLIFELGEYYEGDITELCGLVNPEIGIITGVNEAHFEKFKDIEKTARTIFELAKWPAVKTVYVNGENKIAKEKADPKHTLYNHLGVADFQVSNIVTSLSGTSFEVDIEGAKYKLESNLLGAHQVGPLVLALQLGRSLGIPMEKLQQGVSKTKPFDHRMSAQTDHQGVTIIDDSYNGNPDGVEKVIEFLSGLEVPRKIYATPGLVEMGSASAQVHQEIGKKLAIAKIDKVLLVQNSVTPFIEAGLREAHFQGDILWFPDGLALFRALPSITVSGDVVLLQNDWPDQYS